MKGIFVLLDSFQTLVFLFKKYFNSTAVSTVVFCFIFGLSLHHGFFVVHIYFPRVAPGVFILWVFDVMSRFIVYKRAGTVT
jgi:hypothetical protein